MLPAQKKGGGLSAAPFSRRKYEKIRKKTWGLVAKPPVNELI
jgi:hypothetical protein